MNIYGAEAILPASGGLCNLTEVVIHTEDTLETLKEKVKIATILGTLQSTLTNFRYLRKVWKNNAEEERLLGVSFTGIMDHLVMGGRLMAGNEPLLKGWLVELKAVAYTTNLEWAKKLSISPSKQLSLVKPSGTVSLLVNSSSGIHPRYSEYYIRRVTQDIKDPLTRLMVNQGLPYVTVGEKVIFDFPCASPNGATLQRDMSALQQLGLWKLYYDHWCDGNPSQTIYYTDKDFLEVCAWVYKHWDKVGGLSFFPISDHIYENAPMEEIDKERYEELVGTFPVIDWSKLKDFEAEDETTGSQTFACAGGGCDI